MKKIRDLDERDGIYRITPADAAALLGSTVGKNRKIRPVVASRYAQRMANNEWVLTGEPIILTHGGRFPADGRHRLAASITANKPFDAVVLHCAGESYRWEAMGQGQKRTLDDVFSANGEKYFTHLASTVRFIIRHDKSYASGTSMFSNNNLAKGKTASKDIDNRMGELYLEEHPEIRKWVGDFCGKFKTDAQVVPYVGACIAYALISRKFSTNEAMTFIEPLMSGEGLSAKDPRLLLRKRLYREKLVKAVGQTSGAIEYKVALILKAYRLWKAKAVVHNIAYKTNEQYPFLAVS